MKPLSSLSTCLVTLATLVSAALNPAAHAQNKFGYVNIGSAKTATVTVNIGYGGVLSDILVLTGGGLNKDYTLAKGGTCTIGATYADNSSCTVNISFAPKYPGLREGGVNLGLNNFGVVATAYMQGTGFGPKTSFLPGTLADLSDYVPRLSALAADGNGTVFYISAASGSGSPGAPPGQAGTVGSFPPSAIGIPSQGPYFYDVVVDGAGNLCVYQDDDALPAPVISAGVYSFADPSECPGGYPDSKIIADAARNFYTLPGPIKQTPQLDQSFVPTQVANLSGTGVAVDRDGNVFVADGTLYKEAPKADGTYTQTIVPLSVTSVSTVDLDGVGNLYVTDSTGLYKESLQPDGTYLQSPINIGTLPTASTSIGSVDLFGNVYLATRTDIPSPYNFYDTVSSIDYSAPPALTFATAALGATSTDSPQVVTISNSGNTPLTFSAITFPADFSESSTGSTCTATSVVAAGASCTLAIDFTPMTPSTTTPEALTENVVITTNTLSHAATEQSIKVTGSEIIPASISVTPSSLAFGSSTVGSISAAQVVTLQNTGPSAIKIGTVALVGANTKSFLISAKTCTAMLNPGQSCTYSIESDPAKTGPLSASLGIADNVSGSPQYITLSSTGN